VERRVAVVGERSRGAPSRHARDDEKGRGTLGGRAGGAHHGAMLNSTRPFPPCRRPRPLITLIGAAFATLLPLGARAQEAATPAAPATPAPPARDGKPAWSEKEAAGERGLRVRQAGAWEGYTLLSPLNSRKVHLLGMDGEIVHTWETGSVPGGSCVMLPSGNLLRCGQEPDNPRFHGGGIGGRLEELDWDGQVVWQHVLAGADMTQHHEVQPMENGNLLVIAWEHHERAEAVARGRDPAVVGDEGLWPDVVLELRPLRPAGAEIVWMWRTWDHLVQDFDPAAAGYGVLAEHPGRIDLNADHRYKPKAAQESEAERLQREELEQQMAALGYVGGTAPAPAEAGAPKLEADWLHTNAVDHHAGLDLLVLSVPHLSEVWVIDHSTTTEEAATDRGGRHGRGGELLWRWGNPRNHGAGGAAEQRLFYQHDTTWLPTADGVPPRVLLFNNGGKRPDGDWSEVLELELPLDAARGFLRGHGPAWGPATAAWSYADREGFFSAFISGAQRLPNGNTLICSGAPGHVFEVTPDGRIVWDYLSPLGGEVPPTEQGGKAPPKALFRAERVDKDHPGLAGKLGG
jgi:hypothetical protein